jgi:hypothetical protein
MTPRCDACTYWRLSTDPAESGLIWDADDKQGECRRHAPRPWNSVLAFELMAQTIKIEDSTPVDAFKRWEDAAYSNGITCWPATTGADWCGEFRQREDRP